MKSRLIVILIAAIGLAVTGTWAVHHYQPAGPSPRIDVVRNIPAGERPTRSVNADPSAPASDQQPPSSDPGNTAAPAPPANPSVETPGQPPADKTPPATSSKPPSGRKASKSSTANGKGKAPSGNKPSESEGEPPVAREALSFVGMDENAEVIWVTSINDPSIPPAARKNLIEDLNEDGFPDPKHMTPDDIPLIVSRMALIEDLVPDSLDDVNADAFAEAYKDLAKMLAQAQGQ